VSPQLSAALGSGIRELAQAALLVMSATGTVVLAAVAARRGFWRLRRPRGRTVSAGPWPPVERGTRLLLQGGPARFRAGPASVIVENGGTIVIAPSRSPATSRAGEAVIGRGEVLRVSAADLGEPEEFLASGRTLWLCTGTGRARDAADAAASPRAAPGRRSGRTAR
jgi:hypothetical protein